MSSFYEERLLFCSLCFPAEWERTSADCNGGEVPPQSRGGRRKGGFGLASARSALQEQNLEIHSPPLHYFSCSPTYSHPSPLLKNLKAALNPVLPNVRLSFPRQPPKRCFRAEISGWGTVCVLGQTCPSFDTRADSDSDWATDQDHSLLSPLLPLQSSPTHDMCHCHRSAAGDTSSSRSGQTPKQRTEAPFHHTDGLLKTSLFLNT